jgi:hypothetical protein
MVELHRHAREIKKEAITVMKATILLCAAALCAGCVHDNHDSRGVPPRQSGFESRERMDGELPYRTGPGLNDTDRRIPQRSGPGGLGKGEY